MREGGHEKIVVECFHKIFWDQERDIQRRKKRGQAERAYYKFS